MNDSPSKQPLAAPQWAQNSTLAIVSTIAGILSWVGFPIVGALVAVITGHMARKEIDSSAGRLTGDGFAVVGLILGYAQLALAVIGACLALVVLLMMGGALAPLACLPFGNQGQGPMIY